MARLRDSRSSSRPQIVRDVSELESYQHGVFVPTMGALHKGHLALIERAASAGSPVVVSVFVNPTQFGPGEDFQGYPRSLERDALAATDAGADVVFAPEISTVYPPEAPGQFPPLPLVATQPALEDAHRPGHFQGVCRVVARLFDLVRPAAAVFGEKDYQQLLVVRALVDASHGRWGDLTIISHPTIREADGLALSSRNVYLDSGRRRRALGLSKALMAARFAKNPQEGERIMEKVMGEFELQADYAVIRDAQTLMPLERRRGGDARALVAARVDTVRLIDNMPVFTE